MTAHSEKVGKFQIFCTILNTIGYPFVNVIGPINVHSKKFKVPWVNWQKAKSIGRISVLSYMLFSISFGYDDYRRYM